MSRRKNKRKTNHLLSDYQAQKSAIKRWLLGMSSALVVMAMMTWAGVTLYDPETLPLRSIEVKGEFNKVTDAQVREVVAKNTVSGFFNTDVESISDDLRAVKWVETASVRRVWPDVLQIVVYERKAIANWNKDYLLSADASLFSPDSATRPEGLPHLQGPQGTQAKVMQRYIKMKAMLQPLGLGIAVLKMNARRAWSMRLENGIEFDMGRTETTARLQRFLDVYSNVFVTQEKDIAEVDLRYTNGFTLRMKELTNQPEKKAQLGMVNNVQKT